MAEGRSASQNSQWAQNPPEIAGINQENRHCDTALQGADSLAGPPSLRPLGASVSSTVAMHNFHTLVPLAVKGVTDYAECSFERLRFRFAHDFASSPPNSCTPGR